MCSFVELWTIRINLEGLISSFFISSEKWGLNLELMAFLKIHCYYLLLLRGYCLANELSNLAKQSFLRFGRFLSQGDLLADLQNLLVKRLLDYCLFLLQIKAFH